MEKICLLTNDVETTSIWLNNLNDETGRRVLEEGMPRLLDLYQKYDIQSTFYFTGYIAQLHPEVVKMILPFGHEVASHSFSHKVEDGLDVLSYEDQVWQLKHSKEILEDICGSEIISFRAPALRVSRNTVNALIETGYRIDSSVASQRFDMFMSFGGLKKLNWMFAPRMPYRTRPDNIFRRGDSPLVEVPLSATILPYVGSTLRIFPGITALQRRFLNAENYLHPKPIVFDVHPNEYIDESDRERQITRRSGNYFSYLLHDYARSHLKVKNLGLPGLELYEREIRYFKEKGYRFLTVKDYCIEKGLLK